MLLNLLSLPFFKSDKQMAAFENLARFYTIKDTQTFAPTYNNTCIITGENTEFFSLSLFFTLSLSYFPQLFNLLQFIVMHEGHGGVTFGIQSTAEHLLLYTLLLIPAVNNLETV